MICSFLCLISLSCFIFRLHLRILQVPLPFLVLLWVYAWMFILANFVGKFAFLHPYVDLCLDSIYTCKFCWQICFPSSLCGLMLGQLLYLQILLANSLSFVLMRTYAWTAFILANFVSKFAFLRPYVDLCLDSFYTCKFCWQICFPSSLFR